MIRQDSDDSYEQMFSISSGSRRANGFITSPGGSSMPTRHRQARQSADHRDSGNGSGNGSGSDDTGAEDEHQGRQSRRKPAAMGAPAERSGVERSETGNLTSYTDEHHMITQTTTDSFSSQRDDDLPSQNGYDDESPGLLALPWRGRNPFSSADAKDDDRRVDIPYIIESDYLHQPHDPPYPYATDDVDVTSPVSKIQVPSPPFDPYSLVAQALGFEVRTSALNASAMVLLLKPLIPDGYIDNNQAAAILRQHHSRLMSMSLFVEATLLRKVCVRGWPGGDLAAWGTDYPNVYDPAQRGVQAAFLCSNPHCGRAREAANPAQLVDGASAIFAPPFWHCEHCKATMPGCAVCGHRDAPPLDGDVTTSLLLLPDTGTEGPFQGRRPDDQPSVMTTWWHCPGCGHGGHSSCIQGWHSSIPLAAQSNSTTAASSEAADGSPVSLSLSDGCCPLDGCGHACLPGRWRSETATARSEEVSRELREASARMTVQAAGTRLGRTSYGKGDGGAAAARGAGISPVGGGCGSSNPATPTGIQNNNIPISGGISGVGSVTHLSGLAAPAVPIYPTHALSSNPGGQGLPIPSIEVTGGVRSDDMDVAPSKAVDGAREVLTGRDHSAAVGGLTAAGSDMLGTSPGRGRSLSPGLPGDPKVGSGQERRKSVKFAGTR